MIIRTFLISMLGAVTLLASQAGGTVASYSYHSMLEDNKPFEGSIHKVHQLIQNPASIDNEVLKKYDDHHKKYNILSIQIDGLAKTLINTEHTDDQETYKMIKETYFDLQQDITTKAARLQTTLNLLKNLIAVTVEQESQDTAPVQSTQEVWRLGNNYPFKPNALVKERGKYDTLYQDKSKNIQMIKEYTDNKVKKYEAFTQMLNFISCPITDDIEYYQPPVTQDSLNVLIQRALTEIAYKNINTETNTVSTHVLQQPDNDWVDKLLETFMKDYNFTNSACVKWDTETIKNPLRVFYEEKLRKWKNRYDQEVKFEKKKSSFVEAFKVKQKGLSLQFPSTLLTEVRN